MVQSLYELESGCPMHVPQRISLSSVSHGHPMQECIVIADSSLSGVLCSIVQCSNVIVLKAVVRVHNGQ